jgi:hypothetical protein
MALLFSYGTLQQEDVQLATFGRRLEGEADALPGWEPSRVPIDDPQVAARLGKTHHDNAVFTGHPDRRVDGMAFAVADDELERVDAYEAPFAYGRVEARLASGRDAWVYVSRR